MRVLMLMPKLLLLLLLTFFFPFVFPFPKTLDVEILGGGLFKALGVPVIGSEPFGEKKGGSGRRAENILAKPRPCAGLNTRKHESEKP